MSQFKNLSIAQFEGLIRCQFYSAAMGSDPKECFCEPEIRIEYVDREVVVEKKVAAQKKQKDTKQKQIQIGVLLFEMVKFLW
mgnify:CR=1 FL=1